jgi:hypothetical protein
MQRVMSTCVILSSLLDDTGNGSLSCQPRLLHSTAGLERNSEADEHKQYASAVNPTTKRDSYYVQMPSEKETSTNMVNTPKIPKILKKLIKIAFCV